MALIGRMAGRGAATRAAAWRMRVLAAVAFAGLVPVLHWVPVPPATTAPIPWLHAAAHAALLLGLLAAHTGFYARWQPHAPGRILTNEFLARLWFAVYGAIVVGRASPDGLGFLLVGVPWAALTWEVHRQDVRKRGYDAPWNLANWGLFLLGLALLESLAVWL